MLHDYASDCHDLLKKAEVYRMKIMTLNFLAIDVYNCVNDINPKYPNDHLTIKSVNSTYEMIL